MIKKIVFINNNISYFILHRKKFYDFFESKGYKTYLIFPISEKKHINKLQFSTNIFFFNYDRKGLNIIFEFFSFIKLFIILRKINPKLIYGTTFKLNLYLNLYSFFSKSSLILNYSGLGKIYISKSHIHVFLKTILEFCFRKIFYHNNKIYNIFENKEDYNFFISSCLLSENNCFKLNGVGVNTDFFKPSKKFDKNYLNVIKVSRITKDKGVSEYLELAASMRNNEKFNFYLIGDYEIISQEKKLFNYVKSLDHQNVITYIPWTDDIKKYYALADISILLSFREGMSVFLMESLASGLPIICSNIPSNREIVTHNSNGFLVHNEDIDSIEKYLLYLGKKRTKYLELSINSREKAIKYFSEDKIMTKFEDIVKGII